MPATNGKAADFLHALDSSEDEEDASVAYELPSCLESLASSSEQLQQLANCLGDHCISKLLCYGYINDLADDSFRPASKSPATKQTAPPTKKPSTLDPKRNPINVIRELNKDQVALESLDTLVEALPFLNELCTLIEQCFLTIESAIKRSTYYLNKAHERESAPTNLCMAPQDEFQLTARTKIHSIFVGLMDVAYAIVSLDKIIESHTPGIRANLATLKDTCELLTQTELGDFNSPSIEEEHLGQLPKSRIENLLEYVSNIQLTLCNQSRSIYQQCVEHLQHLNLHLSSQRTAKGYKNLCEHFEEFLEFYGEQLVGFSYEENNVAPTISNESTAAQMLPPLNQLKSMSILLINLNVIPTMYMTTSPSRKLFGLSTLFILYSWLFRKPNKRVVRSMMQTLQRFKAMNLTHLLGSNCYIMIDEFLAKHLPKSLLDRRISKQLADQSEQWLRFSTGDELDKFTLKVVPWLLQFKADTLNEHDQADSGTFATHDRKLKLFNRGLQLAEKINYSIKSFMTTYLHHNKAMSKNQLVPLIRMVALLKSIEDMFRKEQLFVYQSSIGAERFLRSNWSKLMMKAKKRLIALRYSAAQLDTGSMLILTSICSKFAHLSTNRGREIISLGLPMLMATLNAEELHQINSLMSLIYPIPWHEQRLRLAANCGYLYWSWPTLSTYYNYALEEDPCAIDEIHYVHMGINDIASLFSSGLPSDKQQQKQCASLTTKCEEFLKRLGLELMDQFKVDFLDKLCQELEMELRLQTHRELHLEGHNPFRRHLYNFKLIFKEPRTFRILDQQVSLRHHVEQHLNRVCYNLIAIAPHDWFTYDSMINLAKIRYDLQLANTQLPTQSLDCGLDLLDITRHLALFMARYGYDLTNQLFIERCSNRLSSSSAASVFSAGGGSMLSANTLRSSNLNLSLNVIQVKHIAKSIQTHGYGVLNSSVNCTYQVMKRLVNLFAKQMADDRLRATLTKEQLAISSGKQSGISFDRATRMAKKFKLCITNGLPTSLDPISGQKVAQTMDLDSLRQSITQLGNLLGFIRMLKSGALSCASRSADYLPDLDNLTTSVGMAKLARNEFGNSENSRSLLKASENFDQCLADLDDHFSPKTNYFGIVIDLFRRTLTGSCGAPSESIAEAARRPSGPADVAQNRDENIEVPRMESSTPKTGPTEMEYTGEQVAQHTESSSRKSSSTNKRDHLSLFSMLVPALAINYIDYIINCKERALSRSSASRFGALISDDGFPMGVAFLLTVLGQSQSFARLEWFKEVESKLMEDKREVEQRIHYASYEESLKQTSSMTLRRLNRLQVEYKCLNYTLSSALLSFKSSTFVRDTSQ